MGIVALFALTAAPALALLWRPRAALAFAFAFPAALAAFIAVIVATI